MQNIEESVLKTLEIIENPNTVSAYRQGLDHFVESLEISQDEPISSLSLKDFINFVRYVSEKDFSKSTKNLYISAVKKLISYLVVNDLLQFDYADNEKIKQAVKLYIGTRVFVPKVPQAGATEQMIKATHKQKIYSPIKERNIALILFLSTSGCRRSEIANLKVSDVDTYTYSARIYGGKGDKDRRIIISPQTAASITCYWEARGSANPSDPAFARHDKKSDWKNGLSFMSPQSVYAIVEKISKLAKVEVTPHSFRHDVATKLARKNTQLAKEQLGHVSEITTGRYLHFTQDELAKAHAEVFQ